MGSNIQVLIIVSTKICFSSISYAESSKWKNGTATFYKRPYVRKYIYAYIPCIIVYLIIIKGFVLVLWYKFKHILFTYQVRTISVCKSENVYLFPFLFGFMGIMEGIWISTLNIYTILINNVL